MKNVKLIAFDIDGTLTDGTVLFGPNGEHEKQFNIADGLGFRLAHSAGFVLAVISGRECEAAKVRMQGLKTDEIHLGIDNKKAVLAEICKKRNISPEEIAFVGDDINDIPAFDFVGTKIAVANAAAELKRRASYITTLAGGFGAGREAIETILKAQGRYDEAIDRYLKELTS